MGPAPTQLPADPVPVQQLAEGRDPALVAADFPASSFAWAALARRAGDAGSWVESYAYARVGYHRGLDALRRAGWKGAGPVPWSHEPNRGFLDSVAALGRAASAIGEQAEAQRCRALLTDADPSAPIAGDWSSAASSDG
ncbi:MAG TPA: DUF3151 domain-containing protein [Frankiaceae bacterium]|nr:DUF3151 domain-containing protein [Frankiaceae bacterium]